MASSGVYITNLSAFRRDLKAAEDASPRQLTKAIKAAGVPIVAEASRRVPVVTGTLAAGFKASARGASGSLTNRVPYAMGAEFGTHGKWSGFNRYGMPPRFAFPAVEAKADEVVTIISHELEMIVRLNGWAG